MKIRISHCKIAFFIASYLLASSAFSSPDNLPTPKNGQNFKLISFSQQDVAQASGDGALQVLESEEGSKKYRGIKMGGILNLDFVHTDRDVDFDGPGHSKPLIGLAQFASTFQFTPYLNARLSVIHVGDVNEDKTDYTPEVDEVFAAIGDLDKNPLYFAFGRYYLPFAVYKHHALTGTVTKDLSEIRRAGATLGFEDDNFYGSVYLFDKTHYINHGQQTHYPVFKNLGADFGYATVAKRYGYNFYIGYLRDLTQVDALRKLRPDFIKENPAIALHAEAYYRVYGVTLDYTTALHHYNSTGLTFDGHGAKPTALSSQIFMHFYSGTKPSTIATGYQYTTNALGVFLPRWRSVTTLSIQLSQHCEIIFQYTYTKDYSPNHVAGFTNNEGLQQLTGTGHAINAVAMRISFNVGKPIPQVVTSSMQKFP